MKNKATLFIAIIGIILCSCKPQMSIEEQMQDVLDKSIAKYDVHGVSAAVIYADGRKWNGVSGISHAAVPIEPGMLFAIGSITKNFVAALVLDLVEEGVLSLEDPLNMWLPNYPHIDGEITIRQLLNHTSGLYMFWDNQEIWDELKRDRERYWTPEEVLEYIQEPEFPTGEGWRYSNTNYLLLAMIINKATGANLSTALKERFFQPLGLSDIYLSQEETIPANQAHVYSDNFEGGTPIRDVTFEPRTSHESITYGSSGIFTTSENLARWSQALFSGEIIEEDSLHEMLTFETFRPISNMRAYGLGVQEFKRNITFGERGIGHAGGNIGTSTYMVYLPEQQVSVVVMINAFPNEGAEAIIRGLSRVVLKDLKAYGILNIICANLYYSILVILSIGTWIFIFVRKSRNKHKV